MGRIRTVKPELFLHEDLFDLEEETGLPIRLAFIGLFTCCDREGRFKWRPRTLKASILPHDNLDFSRVLDALTTRGFVRKYTSGTGEFGVIPTFKAHQVINNREKDSELPEPPTDAPLDATTTRASRVPHADIAERKGKEGKGIKEKIVKKENSEHQKTPQDAGASQPSKKGSRLSKDWKPTDADIEFCKTKRPDLNLNDVAEQFRDYWISQTGAKATKMDWSATWRNWVRNQKQSFNGHKTPKQARDEATHKAIYGNFDNKIIDMGEISNATRFLGN